VSWNNTAGQRRGKQTVTIPSWLTSKTTWAAVGLACLAIYQATQGQYDQAVQNFLAALAAIGIRHAVAKSTNVGGSA